ncbi:MAG: ABC-type transport auxiliary lipoprotein family protein [Pseudomonadota bacterium]
MKLTSPWLCLALISGLAACTPPINRVDLVPLQSSLQLQAAVSTVMLRTVSLPTYAAEEEVSVQDSTGLIISDGDILWADEPERAATLAVTRHLNEILTATVGPDPWPFVDLPDVAVEVFVSDILATNAGDFRLRGQYFVGGDRIDFPKKVESFDYRVPLPAEGIGGVAAAQSQVLLLLSEDIARSLAR